MPSLTLSPTSVIVSGSVKYTGTGFNKKRQVQIGLDLADWVTVTPARNGTFTGNLTVSATPKIQTVSARYVNSSTIVASATVSVVAATLPPPTTGWASKPAFLSYTASAALTVEGLSNTVIEISGKSFTGTTFPSAAIRIAYCTNCTIRIHDCDFDQLGWDAIDLVGNSGGSLAIDWCRFGTLLRTVAQGSGRRPDVIQLAHTQISGWISNNKIKTGGENEDIFSFVDNSGGNSSTDRLEVSYNAIEGTSGGYPSTSGSGSMLADNSTTGGHINYHHNTVLNPAQVGVGISMGVDVHVNDNIIYGAQQANSNVGLYTPYTGGSPNPGGHEAARNRIWWKNAAGTANPVWDGGASGTISGWATNVLQDATINPADLAVTL